MSRIPVDVSTTVIAARWLVTAVGTGPLSGMFLRGGTVVFTPREGESGYRPLTDQDGASDGPVQVRPLNAAELAARVFLRFDCLKRIPGDPLTGVPDEWVPVMFPKAAAEIAVSAADEMPALRRLDGVVHTPLVRPDGSLLEDPGYDPGSRLLHLPAPDLKVPPVPDSPQGADITAAVSLLRFMVGDFRWSGQHDEANFLGLMLTPLLRLLVGPPYKLAVITAPQPGSGKSLLAGVLRALYGGVFRSEVPEDDAEMRKQVTSILTVTTGPVVQLDNVTGVLRSSTLAGLLTSARWDDRKLGGNEMVSAVNDRLWVITGNNASLGGDLVRRSMWVTIDPGEPDPHLRTDFKIPNLEGWVREHRGDLLAALLTLVRAWVQDGRPADKPRGDSYGPWIATVRGILGVAGVPGVFDDPGSAQQSIGEDDAEWADFLTAVVRVFGAASWSVAELLARVDVPSREPALRRPSEFFDVARIPLDALPAQLAERVLKSGTVSLIGRSLGRYLANRAGRWAGGACVRAGSTERTNVKRWRVETTT